MLTTEIENGAPFDVFLSANMDYPQKLISAGRAQGLGDGAGGAPILYAKGTLVLWTRKDTHLPPPSLDLLRDPRLKSLAIANPERAPYGRAAVAALQSLRLYESLKPRIVTAENIAQAAQFVDSGNAEAGLISMTQCPHPSPYCRRPLFCHSRNTVPAHRTGRSSGVEQRTTRRRKKVPGLPHVCADAATAPQVRTHARPARALTSKSRSVFRFPVQFNPHKVALAPLS